LYKGKAVWIKVYQLKYVGVCKNKFFFISISNWVSKQNCNKIQTENKTCIKDANDTLGLPTKIDTKNYCIVINHKQFYLVSMAQLASRSQELKKGVIPPSKNVAAKLALDLGYYVIGVNDSQLN